MKTETQEALIEARDKGVYLSIQGDKTLSDEDIQEIASTIRAVPTLQYLAVLHCGLQYHRFKPILDEVLIHPSITRINASGNFGIMGVLSFIDAIVKNNPRINVALAEPMGPLSDVDRMYDLSHYLDFLEGREGIEIPSNPVVESLHSLMTANTLAMMSHPFVHHEPEGRLLHRIHRKMPNLLLWNLKESGIQLAPFVGSLFAGPLLGKSQSPLKHIQTRDASFLMSGCAISKIEELDKLCFSVVFNPHPTAYTYKSDIGALGKILPSLLFWADQRGDRQEVVKGIMEMNRFWQEKGIQARINIEPFMILPDKEACGIDGEKKAEGSIIVPYPDDGEVPDASKEPLPTAMIETSDAPDKSFFVAPTVQDLQDGSKRIQAVVDRLPDQNLPQLEADLASAREDSNLFLSIPHPLMKATRELATLALELTSPNLHLFEVVEHVQEIRESFAFVAGLVTKKGVFSSFRNLFSDRQEKELKKVNLPVLTSDTPISFEDVIKQATEKMKNVAPLLRKMETTADQAEAFSLGQAKVESEIAEAAVELADYGRMQLDACGRALDLPELPLLTGSDYYKKDLFELAVELETTVHQADSMHSQHQTLGANGLDTFRQMRRKGMTAQVTFAEAASKIQNQLTLWVATEALGSMKTLEGSLSSLTGAAQMRAETAGVLEVVGELTALAETAMKDVMKPQTPQKKRTLPEKSTRLEA